MKVDLLEFENYLQFFFRYQVFIIIFIILILIIKFVLVFLMEAKERTFN